jgi:hypothetical protein
LKNIKPNVGKEKHKMKIKNFYFIAVLMTLATMLGAATLVWAGAEGGAPDDLASATGPEVWATVVVRCDPSFPNFIALRVKRIKDCNVQTQALVLYDGQLASGCPASGNAFLWQELASGSIFPDDDDINQAWTPIVTKVKNFQVDDEAGPIADPPGWSTATLSFDAQIKFLP